MPQQGVRVTAVEAFGHYPLDFDRLRSTYAADGSLTVRDLYSERGRMADMIWRSPGEKFHLPRKLAAQWAAVDRVHVSKRALREEIGDEHVIYEF